MKNGKRIICATIAMMLFVMTTGTATASNEPIDYWNLYYVANAPASVNNQSQALMTRKNSGGYVAKATTLTGSYDRYVRIYGRDGFVINNTNHYITITAQNVLTSVFYGSGNNTNDAYFRASANGELTCTSNGFVSINDPSIYN